jgi:hypothetical protein
MVLMRHDTHVGRGPVVAPHYTPQAEAEGGEGGGAAGSKAAAGAKRRKPGMGGAAAAVAAASQQTTAAAAAQSHAEAGPAAAGDSAAAAAAAGSTLSAVESLALWQGVAPAEMARRLLRMAVEERDALRRQYAEAHPGPAAS